VVIERISAVTLSIRDMRRAVRFYRALGFELRHGGEEAAFTTFSVGPNVLNLARADHRARLGGWGRVIFYVSDVDEIYARAVAAGFSPRTTPRDAEWNERYFHIGDPDGHELSFARPI
jgi:catechol 2,3-dioxygenase-like lactoylglutathione lyase family enzyme